MRSYRGSSTSLSLWAPFTSASALRTHFRVSFLIEDLALLHDLPQEPVSFLDAAAQFLRRTHDQVTREGRFHYVSDPNRLAGVVGGRHYHEQVYIAGLVWNAVGIRAKQDNLVWLKAEC